MGSLVAALLATVTMVSSPPDAVCATAKACAVRPSTVYVDPMWREPAWIAQRQETVDHELGHIFDYNYMDDGARNRFRSIMHYNAMWKTQAANSIHEQFAEAFWLCARSAKYPPRLGGGYDYIPTTRQHRAVCGMIKRQAAKSGLRI